MWVLLNMLVKSHEEHSLGIAKTILVVESTTIRISRGSSSSSSAMVGGWTAILTLIRKI